MTVPIMKRTNLLYLLTFITATACSASTQYPIERKTVKQKNVEADSNRVNGSNTPAQFKESDSEKGDQNTKALLKKLFPTKQLEDESDIKWSHAPFNSGRCSLCHERDDVKTPGPMKASINEICFGCHQKAHYIPDGREGVHEPVVADCGFCHNAHNSKHRYLLYTSIPQLCLACHKKQEQEIKSRVTHDPVMQEDRCENCHNSHGSNLKACLKLPMDRLCLDCHGGKDEPVKDRFGRVLKNIKALKKEKIKHEPFEKDDCSACHNPHGANIFRLLIAQYPEDFYSRYSDENYALCYRCHKNERITTPQTATLTGFRDGNRNLHYVHVVKPDKGRSCRSCHEDHATSTDYLIRSRVPYGPSGWLLEINYKSSMRGGRCSKTCHDEVSYNNDGIRPKDIGRNYRTPKGEAIIAKEK